jgi:1-acyl-sn-glycerol-3-phosphate acyltransferase
MVATLRSASRLVAFMLLSAGMVAGFVVGRRGRSTPDRARWSLSCARRFLRLFGVDYTVEGRLPGAGVIVSNHLGYLDIVVFAACMPMVFVSKSEVGGWPGIGTLAKLAGTIFLNRARKSDLANAAARMKLAVESGVPVLFFPEGTSSDGSHVLPFHAGLFAPAAEGGWPVTPASIRYELDEGSVEDEVCYWSDMTFLPHFWNLLSKRRIRARVRFGEPLSTGPDRKALATASHVAVAALHRVVGDA